MLNSVNLDNKDYEELRKEAISKIPLYSSEWTNFNPSEPGITILETLVSFQLMQQGAINTITPAVRMKLLQMAGYEPEPANCSRVLIGLTDKSRNIHLPVNQKIFAGDTCFQTTREIMFCGEKILGIYMGSTDSDKGTDITSLVRTNLPIGCEIYTDTPERGRFADILLSSIPKEQELIFYITAEERVKRNPFPADKQIPFAKVAWQIWTSEGFRDIEKRDIYDETCGFLISGEVRIRIPENMASVSGYYSKEGYLIRALLLEAAYDIPPKIQTIEGYLFEICQKESQAVTYTIDGNPNREFELYGGLQDSGYQSVYCLENRGDTGEYYKYCEIPSEAKKGQMEQERYYEKIPVGENRYYYRFGKEGKYYPADCPNAIRIVCYEEDVLPQRYIGKLYGYDNQLFDLSVKDIYDGDFMIMVEYENNKGAPVYEFVRPGMTGNEELNYVLAGNNDKLLVTNPGKYEGARLYIANLSVFSGTGGNVRKGNEFSVSGRADITFYNPAEGKGGRRKETVEELKERFARDIMETGCAVTAEDYRRIILNTPGLAIHKVKAVNDRENNRVSVVVKPYSLLSMPKLSKVYKEQIMSYIEDKRLITTKVTLCSPVYVAIDVHCVIYVKKYAKHCQNRVAAEIKKNLDYISDCHDFGARIVFSNLFQGIDAVEGVEYVYQLSVKARNSQYVTMVGYDIILNDNCLCYPGDIVVDTKTM